MNWTGGIVVYVILWWCVFLAVLPWGVRGVWEGEGEKPAGVEDGAPQDPQLRKKALWTTGIAFFFWLIAYVIIEFGLVDLSS